MEIILREHVEHVGSRGEIVKVANGYARNYLLPRKLALLATEGNKKHVEREREIMDARESEERGKADALAARMLALEYVFPRRVGDTGQLYGSVTSADIAEFLKSKGFEIDRRKLILPDALKALGEHTVTLKLHREVSVPLRVQIVKEDQA
jgi:large subunit ribosomal protein L9